MSGYIVTSYLLFEYDYWYVKARKCPYCKKKSADGDLALAVTCVDLAELFGTERACWGLAKRNGVCEDGGRNWVGHSVA